MSSLAIACCSPTARGLRALETNQTTVLFEVVDGGTIKDHQGINLPGVRVSIPSMTEKDFADLEFGLSQNVDLVALSFVRGPADVVGCASVWCVSKNADHREDRKAGGAG